MAEEETVHFDPSPEELLKVWAFKNAFLGLKRIEPEPLGWLAQQCPSMGRASVLAAEAVAERLPDAPAPIRTIAAFLNAAAAHVTGANMDALNGPALVVFGVLVGQKDALDYAAACIEGEKHAEGVPPCPSAADGATTTTIDGAPSSTVAAPTGADSIGAAAAGAASTTTDKENVRVGGGFTKPKPPSKTKLLAALSAMHFAQEPPKPRSRAPPIDAYEAKLLLQQQLRGAKPASKPAAAKTAAVAAAVEPQPHASANKTRATAASAAVPSAGGSKRASGAAAGVVRRRRAPDDDNAAAVAVGGGDDSGDDAAGHDQAAALHVVEGGAGAEPKAKFVPVASRLAATRPAAPSSTAAGSLTRSPAELAPRVARLLQSVGLTEQNKLLGEITRRYDAGVTMADLEAAIQLLASQGLVVVEYGVVYALS